MIAVIFTIAMVLVALFRRGARPWPELTPHAYRCHECRTGFSDARAIAWHRQGQHVETYQENP
jgi:hypothetical protein